MVRPAPAAVWMARLDANEWDDADAEFVRFANGSGEWRRRNPALGEFWPVTFGEINFKIKLTSFGHIGLFAEQGANWQRFHRYIKERREAGHKARVLNLFAYTGGATVACAAVGAEVTHVDASRGTVRWARENAELNGLGAAPIRWLVDDVREFVSREIRRGQRYDGIILDPPSYGRADKSQAWKIEKDLMELLQSARQVLTDGPGAFVSLSAHSEGYTPISLENQLHSALGPAALIESEEMTITESSGRRLPSGSTAFWVAPG